MAARIPLSRGAGAVAIIAIVALACPVVVFAEDCPSLDASAQRVLSLGVSTRGVPEKAAEVVETLKCLEIPDRGDDRLRQAVLDKLRQRLVEVPDFRVSE